LNRSLAEARLGIIRSKIEWKCKQQGKPSVRVSAKNTSRQCSKCGHTSKENRKSQADFRGHTMNA
jgi:putative transposase